MYAIGGDGFVHKVVNGMVKSHHELVVIPQGTGNDFARSIYKDLDAIKVFKDSLKKEAKPIDVIQCRDDLYCVNVLCCGLDADVGNIVNTNRKTTIAPRILQYSFTILDKIFHLKFYPQRFILIIKIFIKETFLYVHSVTDIILVEDIRQGIIHLWMMG